jgi:predicted metalloprotease
MRWQTGRRSSNVEDRRGRRIVKSRSFKGSIVTIIIALAASWFFGIDPSMLLNSGLLSSGEQTETVAAPADPRQNELKELVSSVLAGTEDTWGRIFRDNGRTYIEPKLILYTGAVQTACGQGRAETGPFYCPADEKVYLDLVFYSELKKMGAPGDFAQAYVIAHEIGHHVQNQIGVTDKVAAMRQKMSRRDYNALSVKVELQADCYAGIWAHDADVNQHWLESGDLEEALNAASKIGDDTLQKNARGYAVPDSFTHGTSAQRMKWFNRGYQSGDPGQCNTFTTL